MRDDTKPTWTLSFDAQLDVFKDRRFDPANPGANTAVGPGYHQFVWSTFVSKRFRWFDPYFGAWYMLPVRTNGSPFQKYGPTQTSVNPQQQAGVMIGVEQIAWENPRGDQRVTDRGARARRSSTSSAAATARSGSRSSGRRPATRTRQPACRPGIDLDTNDDGIARHAVPGHHRHRELRARFGGDLGLNVQVGKYIRFRSLFGLRSDMPHFITVDGAGVDTDGERPRRFDRTPPRRTRPTGRRSICPGGASASRGPRSGRCCVQGSIMF